MRNKVVSLLIFLLLISVFPLSGTNIVNKILYKKVLIKYSQKSVINVVLNPVKVPIKEVYVYFNNEEIKGINKNLKPYTSNSDYFLPTFNFEVQNVKDENVLEVFIVLENNMTLSYDGIINFRKGIIVEEDSLIIKRDQVFFIKVGDYQEEGVYYSIKIESSEIVSKLEELVFEGVLYYKLKSRQQGTTRIDIFKYDEMLENQSEYPYKVLTVTAN